MILIEIIDYLNAIFSEAAEGKRFTDIEECFFNHQVATVFPVEIVVSFPGYKSTATKCDFLVQLIQEDRVAKKVSHVDIMKDIYEYVYANPENGPLIEDLLADIAHNWEDIDLYTYRA